MKHKSAPLSHPASTPNGADQVTTGGPWFRQRKSALKRMKSRARALATLHRHRDLWITGTLWAARDEDLGPRRHGVQARGRWNRCLPPIWSRNATSRRTPSARFASTARPRLLHGTRASLSSTAAILRPQISVSFDITACEQSPRVSKRRSSGRLPTFPDRRLQAFRASPVRANSLAHFWSGVLIEIIGVS
jgi:hypothetical protein